MEMGVVAWGQVGRALKTRSMKRIFLTTLFSWKLA